MDPEVPSNLNHSVRGPAGPRLASEEQKGPEAEGARSIEAPLTCRCCTPSRKTVLKPQTTKKTRCTVGVVTATGSCRYFC